MGAAALQLKKTLMSLLRIQPGEGHRVSLMFGILLCTVGSFIIGRVARDSLFLSRYPVSYLPYLYIWVAVGASVVAYLYSHVADRFRRDITFGFSLGAVLLLTLIARTSLYAAGDWFYPTLYVFVELSGSLLILQAWTLANEVFTTREGKRLFGIVGAGGVVSSALAGFSIRGAVRLIGAEDLLYLCAILLLLCLLLLNRLSRVCREELFAGLVGQRRETRSRISFFSDWGRIFANRHLVLLSGMMVLLALSMTFVDYQFKISARASFTGGEEQLAGFFGLFYGITGLINCVLQFFFTGRILERFGILAALLLLPLSLLGGTISWLLVPGLVSASLLKGGDAVFRYTVNDATMQFLYLPVPSQIRGRAKAFVDGILRPLAIGLSGATLAWLLPVLPAGAMAWMLLAFILLWMGISFGVRRQFLHSLMSTMSRRRFEFDEVGGIIPDEATHRILRKAFNDPDEKNVLHALEMIPISQSTNWIQDLTRLANHSSEAVRAQAIRLLGRVGDIECGPTIAAGLRDRNHLVQAAAIEAYCSVGKERAIRAVTRYLQHPDLAVRSAAVVGLIRYGGLDGVLSSAERLKTMLESPEAEERAAGARILGGIRVKNFYHPLLTLLTDPERDVRLEAIKASGQIRSVELLPALVYRLEEPKMRSAAVEALASFGTQAVKVLQRVLANTSEPIHTRLVIPTILARIGDQAALDTLLMHLEDEDEDLRSKVMESLYRIKLHRPHLAFPHQRLRQVALMELRSLYHETALAWSLALPQDEQLLSEFLAQRRQRAIKRIFRLLGCFLPTRPIDLVYKNLQTTQRRSRSNAIEILDNLLDKDLKRLLLPLLDETSLETRQEIMQELGFAPTQSEKVLHQFMQQSNPWLVVCAIFFAGRTRALDLVPDIQLCTTSSEPVVRETALFVLRQLLPIEEAQKTLTRHLKDPSPAVRAYAAWSIASLAQAQAPDSVS